MLVLPHININIPTSPPRLRDQSKIGKVIDTEFNVIHIDIRYVIAIIVFVYSHLIVIDMNFEVYILATIVLVSPDLCNRYNNMQSNC